MSSLKYHLAIDGKNIGQFTAAEIKSKVSSGQLTRSAYWFDVGAKKWVSVAEGLPVEPSASHVSHSLPVGPAADESASLKKWRDVVATYALRESETARVYGEQDWESCPPRELVTDSTCPATSKQVDLIKGFVDSVPGDLSKAEASRWIDNLIDNKLAIKARSRRSGLIAMAAELLKKTRANRTINNKQRLTAQIAEDVARKVYVESKQLFVLESQADDADGFIWEFHRFVNEARLADVLYNRLARDYPDCVAGDATATRVRAKPALPAKRPQQKIENAGKKSGCAHLASLPFFALVFIYLYTRI